MAHSVVSIYREWTKHFEDIFKSTLSHDPILIGFRAVADLVGVGIVRTRWNAEFMELEFGLFHRQPQGIPLLNLFFLRFHQEARHLRMTF